MTERELAGVIASLRATAVSIRSGVAGGQRIGSLEDGQGVLLSVDGMERIAETIEKICDLLLEAIPADSFIVERHEEKEESNEGKTAEERGQEAETG